MEQGGGCRISRIAGLAPFVLALVVCASASRALDVFEDEKIVAVEGTTYLGFGYAVSMVDDVLVVGAPFRPAEVGPGGYPVDGGPGAVYVFRRQAGTWVQEQKLTASDDDPDKANDFGHSVASNGETILVGAPARTSQTGGHGSAYVFRFEAGSWIEQSVLEASDEAPGPANRFGTSVALGASGDVAIVGAPTTGATGAEPGVYVYRFDGSVWSEETKITSSDGVAYDDFGGAVAVDGDTLAVGADDRNDVAIDAGAAYVFRRVAGAWTEEAKLLASDAAADRRFGWSVAIAGDELLVGSPGELGAQPGAVYDFRFDGAGWVEEGAFTPTMAGTFTDFGKSIVMAGDRAAIGGRVDDGSSIPPASAHVFRKSGASWIEEARLLASGYGGWSFGYALSLTGDRLVVGEHADASPYSGSGSVFLYYDLAPPVPFGSTPALLAGALAMLGLAVLRLRSR